MNLTRLRYFIAVAEAENVGRAAKALNVAQPALSRQLQALEGDVGTPLLERHSRGVRLTPAGRAFLIHARQAVTAAEAGFAAARQAGRSSTVTVSPPDWPPRADLVATAADELRQAHADIQVTFSAEPWTISVPNLRAGVIDIGFNMSPGADQYGPDIAAELVLPEPGLSAVLPARHSLSARKSVRLADMKDLPALIPAREKVGPLHDQMAGVIRSGGYEPIVADAPLNYAASTQLVAVGAGWIITPHSTAEAPPPGTVVRPIDDAVLMLGFYVLRRADDMRRSTLAFVDRLKAVAARQGQSVSSANALS